MLFFRALTGAGSHLLFIAWWLFLNLTTFESSGHAHRSKPHGKVQKVQIESKTELFLIYSTINEDYLKSIKPLFEKKCFDCHSQSVRYPWYYSLPGVKQLIDADIREAREHLDLTDHFPFKGHGTPMEDLEEIAETTQKSSMPPWRYWILHWETRLNEQDKKLILGWVKRSQDLLRNAK